MDTKIYKKNPVDLDWIQFMKIKNQSLEALSGAE